MVSMKRVAIPLGLFVIGVLLAACEQSGSGGPYQPRPRTPGGPTSRPGVLPGKLDKDGMLIQVYDMRDLLHPLTDFRVPKATTRGDGGIFGDDDAAESPEDSADAERRAKVASFLNMLRATVLPDSWPPGGKANVIETDGLLVVKQTPEGHRQLTHLLAELRDHSGVQITVELRALVMPADKLRGLWREPPPCLSDKDAARVEEDVLKDKRASSAARLRLTLLDGHLAWILVQREWSAAFPLPPLAERDPLRPDAYLFGARATASPQRDRVTLSVKVTTDRYAVTTQWEGLDPMRSERWQEIVGTSRVPDKHFAVWTLIDGPRGLLLLIRPQIIEPREDQ
ncbi:MAG: hypothetical protein PHU85_05000 [Phycisphaerae bacterium]|nr:hypothetical protein [Phycisphaerae bacterium]